MLFNRLYFSNTYFWRIIWLLAISAIVGCVSRKEGQRVERGVLDLRGTNFQSNEWQIFPLVGKTEFYWMQLEDPVSLATSPLTKVPSESDVPTEYREISTSWVSPDTKAKSYPSYGFATYRMKIYLPEKNAPQLGLWLGSLGSAHKLWANGRVVSKAGTVGTTSQSTSSGLHNHVIPLPITSEIDLVLQISNWNVRRGGPWERSYLGHLEIVQDAKLELDLRQMLVFGSMCVGSIFFLIIYLAWPRDKSFLLFSVVAMLAGLRSVLTGTRIAYELLPQQFEILFRLDYVTFFLIIPAFVYFLQYFLDIAGNRILNILYVAIATILAIGVIALPVSLFTYFTLPYQVVSLTAILYLFYLLLWGILGLGRSRMTGEKFRVRRRDAYMVLGGFSILAITLINDILLARGSALLFPFETGTIGVLLFLFPIAVMLGIRTARFSKANFELSTDLKDISQAYRRFVPAEFMRFLRADIRKIQIGQVVEMNLTVMFVDVRGFTQLSESIGALESMRFLNGYFARTNPIVRKHGGFIDKFVGDGFISLFPGDTDSALACAVALQQGEEKHNLKRKDRGWEPIQIVIGMNTGIAALGTVGDTDRMETTVIGDTINLAARLEAMAKMLGCSILFSAATRKQLTKDFAVREIDHIKVKGRTELVTIYECYQSDPEYLREQKALAAGHLAHGLALLQADQVPQALDSFILAGRNSPADPIPLWHIEKSKLALKEIANSSRHILLVEDNDAVQQLFRRKLQNTNAEIVTVATLGEAARAIHGTAFFDYVIVDLHLPDGNGLEMIQEYQTYYRTQGRHAIFGLLTADESNDVIENTRKIGVRLYIKPNGIAELVADIRAE